MHPIQAALYARVSSPQQAEAPPVASQVTAWRERIAAEGLAVREALQCIAAGSRGATLVRPALERLRDLAAGGAVDRLYVHSPDRLARKYAYQVLLVDEFQRAGVEIIFLNRALGQRPEDELLLQVQGMMAAYERAKILERHRRGKRHAARAGAVNVLSGAPDGYRYVPKYAGQGQARYDLGSDEARGVRQVLEWIGRDRLSIGQVCRRLTQAGELTRTGRTIWDRSAGWGMLKNPASRGVAAFGKTRQGPLRPRLRAQRKRPVQPRRAVSTDDVPVEAWLRVPVPAIVAPERFAAVQEQLRANQRHARQSRRGARYLLQGLVQGHQCGSAYYGTRLSPSARKGHPRAYAYDRCLGADALQDEVVADMVEGPLDISVQDVLVVADGTVIERHVDLLDGILAAASWAKAVALRFELGCKPRFQGVFAHHLQHPVTQRRDLHSTLPRLPNRLRTR